MLELAGEKEIARVTADGDGNYRAALPPGDYILDVQNAHASRMSARNRNRSQYVANQTVRVDMDIDTGVR